MLLYTCSVSEHTNNATPMNAKQLEALGIPDLNLPVEKRVRLIAERLEKRVMKAVSELLQVSAYADVPALHDLSPECKKFLESKGYTTMYFSAQNVLYVYPKGWIGPTMGWLGYTRPHLQ